MQKSVLHCNQAVCFNIELNGETKLYKHKLKSANLGEKLSSPVLIVAL